MQSYLDLGKEIIKNGVMVHNDRTNTGCLTIPRWDFTFDVGKGPVPILTTRGINWKAAIAELIGYWRGYTSAADFRKLGTKTWDANANLNEAWLNNPHRKGDDDMGLVYGAMGREWPGPDGPIDQLRKVYEDLKAGKDDRGEIISYWNPGMFSRGCLRPCMYEHQFQLIGDTLYLDSTQRSTDVPLGLAFNMIQVFVSLQLMAQITGHKAGTAQHSIKNCHVYENQIEIFKNEQLTRQPSDTLPFLIINPAIKTLDDVLTWASVDDFTVVNYAPQKSIKYPFTV